jgi:hypothetical protein
MKSKAKERVFELVNHAFAGYDVSGVSTMLVVEPYVVCLVSIFSASEGQEVVFGKSLSSSS